jgi:integrase
MAEGRCGELAEPPRRAQRRGDPARAHVLRGSLVIANDDDAGRGREQVEETAIFTAPGDPLFASEVGTPLDYSALRRRVLLPAIEASGIEWPKGQAFHLFRKTAASLLHAHGKSGRQLCDWLGHHDPAFTINTYVGQMDEGLGDAAFMDELIPIESSDGTDTVAGCSVSKTFS